MNIIDDMRNLQDIEDSKPFINPAANTTIDDGTWVCPICGDIVPENINICYHSNYISDRKKL